MSEDIRNWVLSRMDVARNRIDRAINREQYLFWQAKRTCERLPKPDWNSRFSSTHNERLKRIYLKLGNRQHRRSMNLQSSPEWRVFELISREHILLSKQLDVRTDFNFLYAVKHTLDDLIAASRDVLTSERITQIRKHTRS
jgi:hypothetical protein